MENQLVVFCLANELYGVSIAAVSEIIMLQPITYVPRAPAFVEGVTNLRGKVLPVIDLRKRFGLVRQENTKETRIVVAEVNRTPVGMIVDAVSQVLRVAAGAIEPPSPVVTTVDSAFIRGIAKVGSRLVILLDLEQVLLPGEQAELQQVVVQQAGAVVPAAAAPTVESAVEVASGKQPAATASAEPSPEGVPPPDSPVPARPRKRKSRRKVALPPEEPQPKEVLSM